MKKCPYCAEEIQDEAIVCRYCGREQPGYEGEVPQTIEATGDKKSSNKAIVIGLVVVIVLVAIGMVFLFTRSGGLAVRVLPTPTTTPVPTAATCYEQAQEFFAAIDTITPRWDDANRIANSTPRMNLGPAVAELQEIRRETRELRAPDCAAVAKKHLVDYMDLVIEGFVLFIGDEPESTIDRKFDEAHNSLESFFDEVESLR